MSGDKRDERGGAREEHSEAGEAVWLFEFDWRRLAVTVREASNGTAAGRITVGLIWQAQAQSAECGR